MPKIFDFQCIACGEVDEYLLNDSVARPSVCTKCGSTTTRFIKHLAGPCFIVGTTPGSKPPKLKEPYDSPQAMMRGHN